MDSDSFPSSVKISPKNFTPHSVDAICAAHHSSQAIFTSVAFPLVAMSSDLLRLEAITKVCRLLGVGDAGQLPME